MAGRLRRSVRCGGLRRSSHVESGELSVLQAREEPSTQWMHREASRTFFGRHLLRPWSRSSRSSCRDLGGPGTVKNCEFVMTECAT